jgi:hypothetical protein
MLPAIAAGNTLVAVLRILRKTQALCFWLLLPARLTIQMLALAGVLQSQRSPTANGSWQYSRLMVEVVELVLAHQATVAFVGCRQ